MPFLTVNDALSAPAQSPTAPQNSSIELGKDDFLRLFVTKLSHQDPFDPVKDEDFIAQLAQFTSLEQLTNINSLLESSVNQNAFVSQAITNSLSPTLIGKMVRVETGDTVLGESGDAVIHYDLQTAAESVAVEITDTGGSLVRVLTLDSQAAGPQDVSWDGNDSTGQRLPEGQYHITVRAKDSDGGDVTARSYFTGRVDGVRFVDGMALLTVGDALVPMSSVIEVTEVQEGE
ncbi:MAG TPA: flagellar hook assembly protein FlgD [candidate division Zixibacteria bacterium]|nr:flagellar hook assembly protein FlgD [candidate division Zixibacteria bacterium]